MSNNSSLAPIALFCYKRLDVLIQTVEALKNNKLALQSDLIIFSDGYKNDEDKKDVEEVREYIKTVDGFKNINIIKAPVNIGLANSIINGVTKIVNQYGKIIVVEDDILTGPYFLNYMNDALNMYEKEEDVACISAYTYPVKIKEQSFFIKGSDCWGWATWKRGWNIFEPDGQKLLNELCNKKLKCEFDFNYSYPYVQMLKDQIEGKNNSWAIRWYASCFLNNKLCLYLAKPVANNIGIGTKGATHCKDKTNILNNEVTREPIDLKKIKTQELKRNRKIFSKYLRLVSGRKKRNFFFNKEKQGNKRIVTILGFIKFSYEK